MKKNLSKWLLLAIFHLPFWFSSAQAQNQYTPNLKLALPPAAPGTWGEDYNNNFSTLDSAITGTFGTAIAFSGDLTPAQITADQTDYNPTGLSTANVVRLSSDAARTINSLAGGADGRMIILYNIGSQQITLKNNSGIGTATNYFKLNADVVLSADQGAIVQYDSTSSRWRLASSVGSTGVGAAHIIQEDGSGLTARPTLNFTGTGITCVDNDGSNRTDCDVPSGSVDVAAPFTWTGVHSWRSGNWSLLDSSDTSKILKFDISGFSGSTTRTIVLPNASTRLLGDSDFAATGMMARTTSNGYAGRQLSTANSNRISISNPSGIAGNPTFDLGALVTLTDRSNTFSTGDQNFADATSLTIKRATGAAPTVAGSIAFDLTGLHYKGGNGTTSKTFSFSDEVQPLSTLLTNFAGLSAANNSVPIFTNASALAAPVLPSCSDVNGQHINWDNVTHTWSCGTTSTGGLSGATTNKYLIATGANTFDGTSGNLTQSAGVVNASGGFTIGDPSTDSIEFVRSAYTGHGHVNITWPYVGGAASVGLTTGTLTPTHTIVVGANGQLIDSGGTGGAGTWTDTSTQPSSGSVENKTIDVEATGNNITTVSYIQLDAASCSGGTATLQWDDDATGDAAPAAACNDTGSLQRPTANFSGSARNSIVRTINLPPDWSGNIDLTLRYVTLTNSPTGNVQWDIQTACRATGESWDGAYNTAQTITDAVLAQGTARWANDASQTNLTITNCAAGEDMTLKVSRDGAGDSNNNDAGLLWARLKMRRTQ